MTDITVFGFTHSSYVHIARLVLTHKKLPYTFHDLEPDMPRRSGDLRQRMEQQLRADAITLETAVNRKSRQ